MTPTEHLAQGHTPYLKSCKEAGMSEGPWTTASVCGEQRLRAKGFGIGTLESYEVKINAPNARFIAATNGSGGGRSHENQS